MANDNRGLEAEQIRKQEKELQVKVEKHLTVAAVERAINNK